MIFLDYVLIGSFRIPSASLSFLPLPLFEQLITHWTAGRSVRITFFERAVIVPVLPSEVTATMQIFVKTLTGK